MRSSRRSAAKSLRAALRFPAPPTSPTLRFRPGDPAPDLRGGRGATNGGGPGLVRSDVAGPQGPAARPGPPSLVAVSPGRCPALVPAARRGERSAIRAGRLYGGRRAPQGVLVPALLLDPTTRRQGPAG